MTLPVPFGVEPMLAKPVGDELPEGEGLVFEPKWDGFRLLVFKDGDEVRLQSRNLRPFERYVPELVTPLRDQLPDRCVLDGELVVITGGALDFDALQQRIHPAASRVQRLAEATPTSYVAFDLLALGDEDLRTEPFARRRALLAGLLGDARPPLHLTPATTDRAVARRWFSRFEGAGLDGLIAKPAEGRYLPGKRVQFKVKHTRTADCVVAGYRLHKDGGGVGSLLLGIFDTSGRLHHVGVATSFTARRRAELLDELAPLHLGEAELAEHPWAAWNRAEAHQGGARQPGGTSRWNAGKDLSWEALSPEQVAEVAYESLLNGRFRHSARFLRWRPDRAALSCTFEQLEAPDAVALAEVFGADRA